MTPKELREAVAELVAPHQDVGSLTPGWINRQMFIAKSRMYRIARPHLARANTNITTVANQAEYALPSNLMTIIKVKVLDSGEYSEVNKGTQEDLDSLDPDWENEAVSTSTYYYEAGVSTADNGDYGKRLIGFSPAPATAVTNGIKVRYIRKPLKVSDMSNSANEIIDIPEDYHEAIAYYCAFKYLTRQSSVAKKTIDPFVQVWTTALRDYAENEAETNQLDYNPVMGTVNSDGYWDDY